MVVASLVRTLPSPQLLFQNQRDSRLQIEAIGDDDVRAGVLGWTGEKVEFNDLLGIRANLSSECIPCQIHRLVNPSGIRLVIPLYLSPNPLGGTYAASIPISESWCLLPPGV
jgi:hypothetical protein